MRIVLSQLLIILGFTSLYGQPVSYVITSSLYATEDAQTFLGTPSTPNGSGTSLRVDVTSSLQYYRGFFKFNLSSIPSGAIVVSAKLRLTPNGTENITASNSTQLTLELCNTTWAEDTLTHNTGISNNTLLAAQGTSNLVSSKREFDVKDHVQALVDGRIPNHGWRLRRTSETAATATTRYFTREASGTTNDPFLEIKYFVPSEVTAATIVHASTIASNDGSVSPVISNGSSSNKSYTWYNSSGTQIGTAQNLTGVGYGWYGLKVTGAEATDVMYYAFLVGVQCETVSVNFNPNGDYMDDAMYYDLVVGSGNTAIRYSENNHGGYSWNTCQLTTFSGVWHKMRSLMRFRLWLDPEMNVTNANMSMTGDGHLIGTPGQSNAAELIKVESNWKEMGVSDLNKPTSSNTIQLPIAATTSTNQNLTINLSSFFNAWKQSNTANYGMLLQLASYPQTNGHLRQKYMSSDYTTKPTIAFTVNLISNACAPTGYALFKRELDGGYVITTEDGILRVAFDEEYQIEEGKFIELTIYDQNRVIKSRVDMGGNVSGTHPTALLKKQYKYDNNQFAIDLNYSGLTNNAFYVLELTTSTKEKKYLRFQFQSNIVNPEFPNQ